MCDAKIHLSYLWSVATNATEIERRGQDLRDHIDGCPECQELAERQRKAARRLAEFFQYQDGEVANEKDN